MTTNYAKEATDFIKFLIDSTAIYKVDDDNYIKSISENKRITIPTNNDKVYIKIISSKCKKEDNVIILNPYHETLKKTNVQKWFYSALSLSISMKLKKMLLTLIDFSDIQDSLPIEQIKELSPYLNNISKRTHKDIEKITAELIDFANIYYNRKIRLAYFRTGIFETSFMNKFKTIPKKSKELIEKFISNLFDIDETLDLENKRLALKEKYQSKTSKITCPEFICFVNTYYKVLDKVNEKLEYFGLEEYVIDMSKFSYYLTNIDMYYDKTKWFYVQDQLNKKDSNKDKNQSKNSIIPDNDTIIQTNTEDDSSIIPPGYNMNLLQNTTSNISTFPGTSFINQNMQYQFPNMIQTQQPIGFPNQPINCFNQPNTRIIPVTDRNSLF